MAGWFAHEWIANLVLKELSKRDFISKYENIDNYFFGAVAPDIRYIINVPRDITHKPKGENSIFEAMKVSSLSMPFMAGYETHLIVDQTWANDNHSMEKSIYEYYGLDANNPIHKFSLYFLVDDYFQGDADWFFQYSCAGNISRANDFSVLFDLGIKQDDIFKFKTVMAAYLREPGIDTFNLVSHFPDNFEESIIRKILGDKSSLTTFLTEFKKRSIELCVESLERYL